MTVILTFARRLAMASIIALAPLATLPPAGAQPADARVGTPHIAVIVRYRVALEHHDEFRDWIARFRRIVEAQIDAGRLDRIDMCAYKSWRVLGPDAAGMSDDFLFVFEPIMPIGNYNIGTYLSRAPDGEADGMMERFREIAKIDENVIYATPLDRARDGVDLGEDCVF